MPDVHSVAVFCGSHAGNAPVFRAAATEFGRALAEASMRLIYGGGRVGLMGAIADAAISAGGTVIGVIPEFLTRWEVAHDGVADLIVPTACTAASATCSNWPTCSSRFRAGWGRWTKRSKSSPGGS